MKRIKYKIIIVLISVVAISILELNSSYFDFSLDEFNLVKPMIEHPKGN